LAGETGLRALGNSIFDLTIVDIFMPHVRGFESIRIFHERAPRISPVAMSGYAFANLESPAPDFLRMALELGAMPAQTVHAGRIADGGQRTPCRLPIALRRRHVVEIATPDTARVVDEPGVCLAAGAGKTLFTITTPIGRLRTDYRVRAFLRGTKLTNG
jgi:hypothetical protein